MNHPQTSMKLKSFSTKPSILNRIRQDSKVELRESWALLFLISVPKLPSWDKLTLDGQQTSAVLKPTTIVKSQHSWPQWFSHHHLALSAKWLTEHSRPTRLSPSNSKRDTKAGLMPSEESPSNKDLISSSETPSHSTPNTFSAHSLPSTLSIGSKTRLPFSTESPTLPNGRQFGHAPVSQLIWLSFSPIPSTTQLEKWSTCGQRKTGLTFSKETIERPPHGSGSQLPLGTSHSLDSWDCTSGRPSHSKKFTYFRWFLTILAADHLGIFSYWRVDIMSGAGDNTNEDSDIWFNINNFKLIHTFYHLLHFFYLAITLSALSHTDFFDKKVKPDFWVRSSSWDQWVSFDK